MGFLLLGCGGGARDIDEMTCLEIAERYEAEVESIDRACADRSDCTLAGGPDYYACDGEPHLRAVGVNAAAYAGSRASELDQEFSQRGCTTASGICEPPIDCVWDLYGYAVECSTETGRCEPYESGCCHCPPDAGVPDAAIVDAGEDAGRRRGS